MKKIVNILVLIVVCLLPTVVNAEIDLKYEWKVNQKDFIAFVDGISYYRDDDSRDVHFYDKEGNYKGVYDIDNVEVESISSFYDDELLFNIFNFFYDELRYNKELNKYYSVIYRREELYVYGETIDVEPVTYTFESNLDEIKNILGKEFDIYTDLISKGYSIYNIEMDDNYYNVNAIGINDTSQEMLRIYDNDLNVVYEKVFNGYDEYYIIHYFDNKIYELDEYLKLNIYDLNNKLLFSKELSEELVKIYDDYTFRLENFDVKNNNLFVQTGYRMPKGMITGNVNNVDMDNSKMERGRFFVAKFRFEYDVEAVPSSDGEFTYETKVDEYDREYIELKITPKDGYVIDKIIVTDVDGTEIEVTDNKFYMPMNDVKVEVKYKSGEYLPIPDTFLGKSITLILIGLIFISLGFYTINYVRQE